MNKTELLAALAGRPAPFDLNGITIHLRPLTSGDVSALMRWHADHGTERGAGIEIARKLAGLAVCDAAGGVLLGDADLDQLGLPVLERIAREVAARNGLAPTTEPAAE